MKHKNKSILVIDSGIGGLTTLSSISKNLNANFIYFADNKFAPYGNKTSEFLKNRLFFQLFEYIFNEICFLLWASIDSLSSLDVIIL